MSTKTSNASILLRDALIALEDLSFACDGGMGTEAPDREVFNRTFLVLDKIRSELGVGVARDYQPPAHETFERRLAEACERLRRCAALVAMGGDQSMALAINRHSERLRGDIPAWSERETHKHTDECWEPDSGCDMGRNEAHAQKAGE